MPIGKQLLVDSHPLHSGFHVVITFLSSQVIGLQFGKSRLALQGCHWVGEESARS